MSAKTDGKNEASVVSDNRTDGVAMLNALRGDIQEQTRSQKVMQSFPTSRTFYVIASPRVAHIKNWYTRWFPIPHPAAADMYPWLVAGDSEGEFRAAAARAVAGSYSAALENRLRTTSDFRFIESLAQVLVIADLSEPEAISRVAMIRRVLGEEIGQVVAGQDQGEELRSSVVWSGVFTLRRPSGDGADSIPDTATATRKTIDRLGKLMADNGFTRVLLVDNRNSAGRYLDRERDSHIVAAELLYFLTFYPARLGVAANFYDEWLNRCPADQGRVTGAAAISLVLPIDQILETVALYRGADVLEHAFLSDGGVQHSRFYMQHFLQTAGLISSEIAAKTFTTHDDVKLEDPLVQIDGLDSSDFNDFAETATSISASLPGLAVENGKRMREIAERRLADWRILFEDHVESILANEAGGLPLAGEFLDELKEELHKLTPAQGSPPPESDNLSELLAALKKTIAATPRTFTMSARALAISVIAGVGVYFLPLTFITKAVMITGVPAVSFGSVAWMVLSHKDRVRRQGELVREALRTEWARLMKMELDPVMREFLSLLIQQVKQTKREILDAERRIKELVGFLREQYVTPFPEEYAAWCYVLRERKQLLKYIDLCKPDLARLTNTYLKPSDGPPPLYPWRRLSPARSEGSNTEPSEPNAWEWRMIEKAACLILPSCSEIIHKGVLDYLPDEQKELQGYVHTLISGAEPYISLRANRETQEDRLAIVEVVDADTHQVAGELHKALIRQFPNLRRLDQLSRYRISCFGFLENALLTDVVLPQRKGSE